MNKLLVFCLLAFSLPATADIYKWTDADGHVHFGDQATPDSKAQTLTAPKPANSTPAAPAGDKRAVAPHDDMRERQRRVMDALQQDAAERERAAQQQAAEKAQRNHECQELRDTLQAMDGRPAYFTGPNDERQYLDEAQRKAYVDQANATLKESCQ